MQITDLYMCAAFFFSFFVFMFFCQGVCERLWIRSHGPGCSGDSPFLLTGMNMLLGRVCGEPRLEKERVGKKERKNDSRGEASDTAYL